MPNDLPSPRRVVVIDDSVMVRDLIAYYLRDWLDGHGWADTTMRLFTDGNKALQELSRTDPVVLITDMQRFDGMSGWEMLPLLAERNVKYPVLLVTGYGEGDVRDLLRSACSNLNITILSKPFRLADFRKALESCLKT